MDTTVTALGVTRRAVLTHSPTLHAKQSRGFDQTLAKAARRLAELPAVSAAGKTRRSKTAVQAEIDTILKPRWVNQVITVTLTGDEPSEFRLTWRTDTAARKRLEQRLFGKRILFTNRDDWPTVDVVAAYRSQSEVEGGFRQLKDPHVVSFSPMHHWTDSKIRVHVFYCVLALTIAHLMRRASPPGRSGPVRPGTAAPTQRHRGDRAALPRRQQRPPPRPSHDHRDDPHPINSRRPVPHPPIRADPLTHHSPQHNTLGNTPESPENTLLPGRIKPPPTVARKLPLAGVSTLDH